jgi:hypothetical protein
VLNIVGVRLRDVPLRRRRDGEVERLGLLSR